MRVDGGYRVGDAIPTAYDSLIAKLIVHAESRDEAIMAMDAALAAYAIEGVPTTIPFHRAALAHPRLPCRWRDDALYRRLRRACRVSRRNRRQFPRPRPIPVGSSHSNWMASAASPASSAASPQPWSPPRPSRRGVRRPGSTAIAQRMAPLGNTVLSPIGGVVVRVGVTAGQAIAQGAVVAVVEAMKMENEVQAARDGVVAAVHVSVGDSIQVGTLLATFAE